MGNTAFKLGHFVTETIMPGAHVPPDLYSAIFKSLALVSSTEQHENEDQVLRLKKWASF